MGVVYVVVEYEASRYEDAVFIHGVFDTAVAAKAARDAHLTHDEFDEATIVVEQVRMNDAQRVCVISEFHEQGSW